MLVTVAVLTFSSLVYFAEKEEQNWSYVDSFWWGLLTITTVGYGNQQYYWLIRTAYAPFFLDATLNGASQTKNSFRGIISKLFFQGTITPLSGMGRLIGGFCAVFGAFTIVLPVPIIVNSFSNFYKNRLWRGEVAMKRRERLVHINANKVKQMSRTIF